MKVSTILDQIDLGTISLPKFQRGYVWNRDQVRKLVRSLYRRFPIGSLLVWVTDSSSAKGQASLSTPIRLLLDGQQRLTSLYGLIRGNPPPFFDGNPQMFTGLHFHLDEEIFEFYASKMKDDPLWIDVTRVLQTGVGPAINQLTAIPELQPKLNDYINRLTAIDNIKDTDLHVEEITGEDKTVEIVVDIFNIVNSGGTKLSKGDLALAKLCTEWPEAREEMKSRLERWRRFGFYFRLEWLLRVINAITAGEAFFTALKDVDRTTFEKGLREAEKTIDYLVNLISGRLGLDHDRVLGSKYSFPTLAKYVVSQGGQLADHSERDKVLYWYVHTFLWGRYAGSTETVLNRDLNLIQQSDGTLERLINELRQNRGDLRIYPDDFAGWSVGARFYPVLYMLTRAWHATDWDTGVELSSHLLGSLNHLELHHIFPKVQLRRYGYSVAETNAIANFTFLTKETNLKVSDRLPEEYLPEFDTKQPSTIESHWIPKDRNLWSMENYREFLKARQSLLASAANDFLDSLIGGTLSETPAGATTFEEREITVPGGVASEEEERKIQSCNDWVVAKGLPAGQYMYELADEKTGEVLAILDLAWPEGIQECYSQPVALLIDEPAETMEVASRAGYRCFTDVDHLCRYVETEILSEAQTVSS